MPYLILLALLVTATATAQEDDPLAQADYLSPLERDLVREMNAARTDPQGYIRHLKEYRASFDGKRRRVSGNTIVVTQEGTAAVDEAIAFLREQPPLEPLRPSRGMSQAAADHVEDIGPAGLLSHRGTDGSLTPERINRYGYWREKVGENIAFGGGDARTIIVRLIVDDGVPDRGHRETIFTPGFEVVGAACGPHRSQYDTVCVTTFAGGFEPDRPTGARPAGNSGDGQDS